MFYVSISENKLQIKTDILEFFDTFHSKKFKFGA